MKSARQARQNLLLKLSRIAYWEKYGVVPSKDELNYAVHQREMIV